MREIIILAFTFVFLLFPHSSFAQEMMEVSPSLSPTPTPTRVDYTLPYPGILPGNPIYPIKVFRDRIVEFFISSPMKRADFYLRQGDKHLAAGQLLVIKDHQNFPLAESTISKGENYMEYSLDQIPTIKALQLKETDFLNRLITALKKHNQVIKDLEKSAPEEVKIGLEKSRQRTIEMQKKAEVLRQESQ